MCSKIRGVQEECGLIVYLLNIFVAGVVECADVERASCPGNRRTKCFYKWHFRIYL
jgi:hypothetical protein